MPDCLICLSRIINPVEANQVNKIMSWKVYSNKTIKMAKIYVTSGIFLITWQSIEGTARGLTSSSCGGLEPLDKAFFGLREKNRASKLFVLISGNFWLSVVTSIKFRSNLSNFEINPKISRKNKNKKSKNLQKKSKNLKTI